MAKPTSTSDNDTSRRRSTGRAVRLLMLVDFLRKRPRGARQREAIEVVGVSRQTLHEDLADLAEIGFPFERFKRNGEAWLKVSGDWLLAPGSAELFALVVAQQALRGLNGSAAQQWLTPRLLNLTSGVPVVLESTLPVSGNFAAVLEAAITKRHRVSVRYQGMKDIAARDRIFEPIDLRLSQRAWYVFGIDVDSKQPRTFKLSRLETVTLLADQCSLIEHIDANYEHEHAVNVWNSADVYDVAVRIFPPQARVAHEYPLTSTQHIEPDGEAVIVHAKVSGLEEVTRWVLRWGGDAQVLAPKALQDRLGVELARMTAHLAVSP